MRMLILVLTCSLIYSNSFRVIAVLVSLSAPSRVAWILPHALFLVVVVHGRGPFLGSIEPHGHDHNPFHGIFHEIDLYLHSIIQNQSSSQP